MVREDLNTKLGVDITEDSFKNDGNDNDNEDDDLNEKELYEKYIPILRNIKDHFEPLGFSISKHSGLRIDCLKYLTRSMQYNNHR